MSAGQHADNLLVDPDFPRQLDVLVVDDDFGDYDAVARALRKVESFEISVTRAKTVEAARKLVQERSFDIYFIDYNLGAESGARIFQEIGGRSSRGAAILLTGLTNREVQEIALRAGAICCVNKSDISPTMLETTMRCAIYTHRLEAKLRSLLVQTKAPAVNDYSARSNGAEFARLAALSATVSI